jgi:carboxymethylenebutenolidase
MQMSTASGEAFEVYQAGCEDANRGILILHDWWGMGAYTRQWAERFAGSGYLALAVDLYDGRHTDDPKQAGEWMKSLDQNAASAKVKTALDALHARPRKVAVLGWSMGGSQALLAGSGFPDQVQATVFYYCRLLDDIERLKRLAQPVLGIFAEREPGHAEKMAAFKAAMQAAQVDYTDRSYPAEHGFVNFSGSRYDRNAAQSAWRLTCDYLDERLA